MKRLADFILFSISRPYFLNFKLMKSFSDNNEANGDEISPITA
jgi:hypothetical protein